ncbi:peptidoglycan-binding domain-containing protein [Streptomyces longispororuber]|uniref:peptidoglycan-binding domain-containing protein n=1 Tax=Streptomyces longispororuber TaxID=68230 RepID=UPI0033F2F231
MGPEEPALGTGTGAGEGRAGPVCPRCGTSRAPDGAPACGCARQAADAVLETRSAQAAAAEDFDPLRIRPYVTLPEPASPLPALGAAPLPPGPRPASPPPAAPPGRRSRRAPRRGRTGLLAGAGALVASAAVFATGMFWERDGGGSERALPDTTATTDDPPPEEPAARVSAERVPRPAPRAVRPSHSARPSPAPSASRSPSASASATPRPRHAPATSPTRTTARATGRVDLPALPSPSRTPSPGTLRLGDRGEEVAELQSRLRRLSVYAGPADGVYTAAVADAVARYQWARGILDDPLGTYGPTTRRTLEAETTP